MNPITYWKTTIRTRKYVRDAGEKYSGSYEYTNHLFYSWSKPIITNPRNEHDRFVVVEGQRRVEMFEKHSVESLTAELVTADIVVGVLL